MIVDKKFFVPVFERLLFGSGSFFRDITGAGGSFRTRTSHTWNWEMCLLSPPLEGTSFVCNAQRYSMSSRGGWTFLDHWNYSVLFNGQVDLRQY
jgi:hypothetical protein